MQRWKGSAGGQTLRLGDATMVGALRSGARPWSHASTLRGERPCQGARWRVERRVCERGNSTSGPGAQNLELSTWSSALGAQDLELRTWSRRLISPPAMASRKPLGCAQPSSKTRAGRTLGRTWSGGASFFDVEPSASTQRHARQVLGPRQEHARPVFLEMGGEGGFAASSHQEPARIGELGIPLPMDDTLSILHARAVSRRLGILVLHMCSRVTRAETIHHAAAAEAATPLWTPTRQPSGWLRAVSCLPHCLRDVLLAHV